MGRTKRRVQSLLYERSLLQQRTTQILKFGQRPRRLADIGLNVVGLIPGVGDLAKASKLGKNAIKTVDAVADVTDGLNDARKAIKRTDALVDAAKTLNRGSARTFI